MEEAYHLSQAHSELEHIRATLTANYVDKRHIDGIKVNPLLSVHNMMFSALIQYHDLLKSMTSDPRPLSEGL
jgi:hypothetical protein